MRLIAPTVVSLLAACATGPDLDVAREAGCAMGTSDGEALGAEHGASCMPPAPTIDLTDAYLAWDDHAACVSPKRTEISDATYECQSTFSDAYELCFRASYQDAYAGASFDAGCWDDTGCP